MRLVFSVFLGAVVASAVFFLVAFIDNAVRPTSEELMDPATPEAVEKRVNATPTSKWIAVLAGLALGAFVGGMTTAKMVAKNKTLSALIVGLLLSPWAAYTFYVVYPAVLWVPGIMLFSVFLCPWLGSCVVKKHAEP